YGSHGSTGSAGSDVGTGVNYSLFSPWFFTACLPPVVSLFTACGQPVYPCGQPVYPLWSACLPPGYLQPVYCLPFTPCCQPVYPLVRNSPFTPCCQPVYPLVRNSPFTPCCQPVYPLWSACLPPGSLKPGGDSSSSMNS
uniref:Uncharacterized protein n=1 Tax=Gadus morhua TaxID=8049 RepID=A0A8C5FPV1_GADMO